MTTTLEGTRNEIILSGDPKGHFTECIVDGTPKPGTLMTIKLATAPVNKRFVWEAYNRDADGDRAMWGVLINMYEIGQGVDVAYVSGARGKIYFPLKGDELLVLFGNAAGTADDVAIGSYLIIDDATGKVIPTTGSPECEPFVALEDIVDPIADQLLHVMVTGD